MRTEACGAALALSLNSNNSAANDGKHEPYGNGKPIKLCPSQKIQAF
jgi:hypothetical protein